MNISVQKLLKKMEEELRQARQSGSEAHMRERVHAIKALCELVLGEQVETDYHRNQGRTPDPKPEIGVQKHSGIGQAKRAEIDDEANGDSLFDF